MTLGRKLLVTLGTGAFFFGWAFMYFRTFRAYYFPDNYEFAYGIFGSIIVGTVAAVVFVTLYHVVFSRRTEPAANLSLSSPSSDVSPTDTSEP
jgi:hypothetical protein